MEEVGDIRLRVAIAFPKMRDGEGSDLQDELSMPVRIALCPRRVLDRLDQEDFAGECKAGRIPYGFGDRYEFARWLTANGFTAPPIPQD